MENKYNLDKSELECLAMIGRWGFGESQLADHKKRRKAAKLWRQEHGNTGYYMQDGVLYIFWMYDYPDLRRATIKQLATPLAMTPETINMIDSGAIPQAKHPRI